MSESNSNNFTLKPFCYDLSCIEEVDDFTNDVLDTFQGDQNSLNSNPRKLGQLDCLINNAAVFDDQGPNRSKCGKYDLTFMVNVLAPFIMT